MPTCIRWGPVSNPPAGSESLSKPLQLPAVIVGLWFRTLRCGLASVQSGMFAPVCISKNEELCYQHRFLYRGRSPTVFVGALVMDRIARPKRWRRSSIKRRRRVCDALVCQHVELPELPFLPKASVEQFGGDYQRQPDHSELAPDI